ncbi:conserved hypothetical protein (DUF1569) [Formosa agariphila KMM 3901]|uniref:DUF1569 domain-containing protein n=1 Tax=Formosa agariphila (strain DSM 15362 / KCTC 12365 / LMG 23005 / KMM 3901 / M-2Alg 35-1) TaxID=1347342 RepID=T2KNE8_FORAG|nr:DUF1569 domain-containing protein [Formosa agariphila]CDF80270.1 conserved hypothetical protein (DUF1569) [Formosa agariphila KMM 3901]
METIFNQKTINLLTDRINQLKTTDNAQWGEMNAYQMLKHCTLSEEMFQGKKQYKRLIMGKLFGKMALNGILKNDNPMKKNQPTHPEFKIKGTGNFEIEKAKWIDLLNSYSDFFNSNFVHPFFGKMSKDEIGKYVFKHTDHHLRQFGR